MIVQAKAPRLRCCDVLLSTDSAGMREARTSPTTSSITAALIKTVPIRLFCNGGAGSTDTYDQFSWNASEITRWLTSSCRAIIALSLGDIILIKGETIRVSCNTKENFNETNHSHHLPLGLRFRDSRCLTP